VAELYGDGGEVMAEDDPLVGGLEIVAVLQTPGRSGAAVSTSQILLMCSPCVMAIAPRQNAATAATPIQKRYRRSFTFKRVY